MTVHMSLLLAWLSWQLLNKFAVLNDVVKCNEYLIQAVFNMRIAYIVKKSEGF